MINLAKYVLKNDWGFDSPFKSALSVIRHYLGVTMQELSNTSGVSQSYISQLETGTRVPSDAVIKKLSHALAGAPEIENKVGVTQDKDTGSTDKEAIESWIYENLKAARYFSANDLDAHIDYSKLLSSLSSSVSDDISVRKNDVKTIEAFLNLSESERELIARIIRNFHS